ncbi:hypothetical protein [Chengkuizengella marina]|nr:hypothetical protein [Chengkuizengella marina]
MVLKQKDPHATFMDKSIHYIFPFQDDILEIAAWGDFKVESISLRNIILF